MTAGTRGRLLIVLDTSFSMLARTSTGETRWDRAVREARRLAASAGGDDIALATTSGGLVEGPTSDLALIETAIEQLRPIGGDSDAWPRVSGADSVHFITDGAVDRPLDSSVVLHSVFDAAPNVAVIAFEVRPPTTADAPAEAYIEIANYAADAQRVRYTITRGTAVVLDNSIDLAAGEVGRQIVPIDARGDARLRARVTADANALRVDDEAVAWMDGAETLRVAVVSEQPGPLALLLGADASLTPVYMTPATYRLGSADVVIFDRWLPDAPPARPMLAIAPPAASWLGTPGAEEKEPRWTLAGGHAVLQGLDPLTLDIKRARAYEGTMLAPVARSARGTPLVSVVDHAERRAVVLGFAFSDSNLAFARAFPVIVGNAVDWLGRPVLGTRAPGPVVLPGSTAKVTAPDGSNLPLVRAGERTLTTLERPGLYLVDAGGSRGVLTVNVGDPEVSNLTRTHLPASAVQDAGSGGVARSWWLYAVAAAFVLACVEWLTWQRRITV